MKPMQILLAAVAFGASVVVGGAVQAAPLYVADYVASEDLSANPWGVSVLNVQPGVAVTTSSSWRHGPLLGMEERMLPRQAIAVDGRIDVAGPYNHTYNLDGSGQVSTICGVCSSVRYYTDGTTDGRYNYTIGPETVSSATVGIWRTDRDWRNEYFLFPITAFLDVGEKAYGITYDPGSLSLWVAATAGSANTRFLELSLDGTTLKSQFSKDYVGASALAMDYADDTLWSVPYGDRYSDSYFLTQFNRQGDQISYAQITADHASIGGAEFNLGSRTVPEPNALALLGLGLLGLGIARVRKG
jgi:hypothetical protein